MKAAWLTIQGGEAIREKKKNGCHVKNIGYVIFPLYMPGAGLCINVQNMKFLRSSLWPGLSTDDDTGQRQIPDNDDNNTRRTVHECVGSK